MELDLKIKPGEWLTIRCNGEILAEGVGETLVVMKDDHRAIRRGEVALTYLNLLAGVNEDLRFVGKNPDHNHKTAEGRVNDYLRGLLVGLADEDGVLFQQPRHHGPSHVRGFERGQALRRAMGYVRDPLGENR